MIPLVDNKSYVKMQKLFLFVLFIAFSSCSVKAQRVNPTADGYIFMSGTNQNNNYGTETQLRSRYSRDPQFTRQSFIRFDISNMNEAYESVTFNIFGKSNAVKYVDIYSAFGNWTDISLKGTANLKPSLKDYIGTFRIATTDQYYSVEIGPYIRQIRQLGMDNITIVVVDRIQQDHAIEAYYHSKENTSGNAPFLQFTSGQTASVYDTPNVIYMDAENGNDDATGLSPDQAWKTLERAEKHFFKSEDKLLFKRGSVFYGSLYLKHLKNSNALFEIGSYGTGELPVLDAFGSESYTLRLFNQSNILVQDIEITNFSDDVPIIRRGIYCQAEDAGEIVNTRFNRLKITNINGALTTDDGDLIGKSNSGIFAEITGINTPTRWNGYVLENSHFYRIDRHGAANQSSWQNRTLTTNTNWYPSINMHIRNNIFEECASDGLIVRVAHKPIMEYNLFTKCSYKLSGNASFSFNTDSAIWQFNESRYTVYQTGDHDAGGFDSDYKSKHTIIQYNYSHNNEYGGVLITGGPASYGGFNEGTIVRHNVFYNNGHHGFRLSGMVTNCHIYNNTSYNDDNTKDPTQPYDEYGNFRMHYHKNWGGWPQNTRYSNNIYYYINSKKRGVQDLSTSSSLGTIFSHNLIFGSNIGGYPFDANALRVNPGFKYDVTTAGEGLDEMKKFVLSSSSPCIDYGTTIPGAAKFDYEGNPVPINGKVDVGAFEYNPFSLITQTHSVQAGIEIKNNPVFNELLFKYKHDLESVVAKMQILNMQGKVLIENLMPIQQQAYSVDVNSLNTGAYILRVLHNNLSESILFMKL